MDTFLQDVRYALRQLVKNPGFAVLAALTLALGIGANTAIFSVVNGVVLRPLPFEDADRLVMVGHHYPELDLEAVVSPVGFTAYRGQHVFEEAGAITGWGANLSGAGEPVRLQGAQVTADFLPTLGLQPILGRGFLPSEEQPGNNRVILLGETLWERQFGADPTVVGRTLTLDGEPYEVVGVVPSVPAPFAAEVWVPLAFTPEQLAEEQLTVEFLAMVARLAPGVSIEAAREQVGGVVGAIVERVAGPDATSPGIWMTPLRDQLVGDTRAVLLVLLGAVGFVLLIACANVANLLLARAAARRREMALRTALGAARTRLVRQLATESLILGAIGGTAGLALAQWTMTGFLTLAPGGIPRLDEVAFDGRVLAFTLAVTLLASLVFGLMPALQGSRSDAQEALKEAGAGATPAFGRRGVRRAIVVSQIAAALVLMIGAGLMVKSFLRMQDTDPGFRSEGLLTLQIALPQAEYGAEGRSAAFYRDAIREIEAVPGVQAAGGVSALPLSGMYGTRSFNVEGYEVPPDAPDPWGGYNVATPGYFQSAGIPVLRGRTFSLDDFEEARPVIVVDEGVARRYWPNEDPIGRGITFPGDERRFEVIGVVGGVATQSLHAAPLPQLYVPSSGAPQLGMFLTVRFASDEAISAAAVREAIGRVDPNLPVYAVRSMEEYLAGALGQRRFAMLLLASFALLALLLSGVGVYGVMSYAVAQRTRELGIRMALGAEGPEVVRLVVRQAAVLALTGVALGVLGALALTRLLSGMLFEVSATDPVTFITIPLFLAAVALLASFIPARGAARVDPMVALRPD